jgi:hypothetical protein
METKPQIEEIVFRHGQISGRKDASAQSTVKEVVIRGSDISENLRERINSDDIFSLNESYGDPAAGDPILFEFVKLKTRDGRKKEIEVFNLAILMLMDNREETRRLFRIIHALKSEE